MGRIDAIIDDNVIQDFKVAIIRRKGGKKGDFSKSLEEAMNLWIKSDIIEKLKDSIGNSISNGQDDKDLIDALKSQGQAAMPALIEIRDNQINSEKKSYTAKAIKELSQQKS